MSETATSPVTAAATAATEAKITKALDSLPTLPIVALRVGEVVHDKNVSVQQVADILKTDPAMSAKLLRLVNSPYFGIPGGVTDVSRAIPFVGFNTLYQLVLSISVLETLGGKNANGIDMKGLWIHALTVATAARELANEIKLGDPGACFTAGLLHDMGKIAVAKFDPVGLAAALASNRVEGISMSEAEARHGLPSHDRIGSKLARAWKFPATLTTPIEHHHEIHRPEIRERLGPNLRTITEIVAAADQISQACSTTFTGEAIWEDGGEEHLAVFERNGFTAQKRVELVDKTRVALEKSKVFLSLLG
jgi:putative nucleotidyltransferase with HDIG domain